MNNSFVSVFASICVVLAAFDFFYGYKAIQKQEKTGRSLGLAAISAGIITLAYLYSILTKEYTKASAASSIYFLMIDWMLIALVYFAFQITGLSRNMKTSALRKLVCAYALFDSVVLVINIFREIAVHYTERPTLIAHYVYEMKPLYLMHLAYTYLLIAITICILIQKCITTPRQYRNQYGLLILAIAVSVIVNAVFLLPAGDGLISLVDFSVIGYSIGLFLMYWAAFEYRTNNMLKSLSMTIFENIGQGIVLFDHTGQMIMHNKEADRILEGLALREKMNSMDFAKTLGIPEEILTRPEYTMQCQLPGGSGFPVQCVFRRLYDRFDEDTGYLYVLSELSNENDLLTGFQHWENFHRFMLENPYHFSHPTAVAVFDIIGLGHINRTFGREVGDQRIRNLVRVMRKSLPPETHFVRGYEAHLIAICMNRSEEQMQESIDAILDICGDSVIYGLSATSARPGKETPTVAGEEDLPPGTVFRPENYDILQCVDNASHALQVKKLLNAKSLHSQTLSSLVRALQESDTDTEAHVQRTQRMGEMLGRRVGLSDLQLAELRLLCLLHDIGKIGIPLEILNKPGRLSDAEWEVLHSHAEKGCQIALSSDELRSIAPMILSHHERWDGRGYPEKIAGQNIPVLSRIISVVDAYDAMVNDRAYRKALPVEKAKAEIRNNAGTQFDPYLAAVFLKLLEENPDIARGEKIGGEEVRVFMQTAMETEASGSTYPIRCSRYLLNLDDVIIEVDDMFEEITGYSRMQAVNKLSQYDLIPEEDRSYYILQVNNQFSKGSYAYLRHNLRCADGEIKRVICYGKHYFDSAEKAFRSEILIFPAQTGPNE